MYLFYPGERSVAFIRFSRVLVTQSRLRTSDGSWLLVCKKMRKCKEIYWVVHKPKIVRMSLFWIISLQFLFGIKTFYGLMGIVNVNCRKKLFLDKVKSWRCTQLKSLFLFLFSCPVKSHILGTTNLEPCLCTCTWFWSVLIALLSLNCPCMWGSSFIMCKAVLKH